MKLLAIFLVALVGLVSAASVHDALDASVNEYIKAFEAGMDSVPSAAIADDDDEDEDVTESSLVAGLRAKLAEHVAKIKARVDERHEKAGDLIEKAKEVAGRLHELRVSAGKKVREAISNYHGKGRALLDKILEHVRGITGGERKKRQAGDDEEDLPSESETKKKLSDHVRTVLQSTIEKIKERIDHHHGKAGELLTKATETADRLKQLHASAGDKIRELLGSYHGKAREIFDRIMEHLRGTQAEADDEEEELDEEARKKRSVMDAELEAEISHLEKRAVNEVADQIKDFVDNLRGQSKGRFADFAEWLKTVWAKGADKARTQHEKLVNVAKEVRDHAREMHKETVREAMEALKPHHQELGRIWEEVKEHVKKAVGQVQATTPDDYDE